MTSIYGSGYVADMTDITERLRRIYVSEGANYVQEAANEIQRLRAERDMWKDTVTQRDRQILGLVNDVHSCHPDCAKAGCVNRRLRERVKHLEQLVTDATYTLSTARFWDGQKWSYHSLHPIKYTQMRERLSTEADAIYAAKESK